MDSVTSAGSQDSSGAQTAEQDWARRVGWLLFLAFIGATPLVIGALPPQAQWLTTWRTYDPVSLPKDVTFLVLSGLSLAALCISLLRGESELRWHPVMWILVALLGWAAVSTAFASSPALAIWGSYDRYDGLVALLGYVLVVFLAIQYVRSTSDLRTVIIVAAVSGILVAIYALFQSVGIDPYEWTGETGRVMSSLGNADMLGNYLLFPFALTVGLALSAKSRLHSAGWWGSAAVIAAALYFTVTRGAWVAALVVLVCIAFAARHTAWKLSHRAKLVTAGVATAVVAAALIAVTFLRPRSGGTSASLTSALAGSSNGRTLIWATGLRAWLSRPITGWGPDGFQRAFESAVGANWYAMVHGVQSVDNAHNFLVQALVTLGIPGLVLLLWALVQTVLQSFRSLSATTGRGRLFLATLWGALVGMTVALLFGVTLPEVSAWWWLIIGLLLAPMSHRVSGTPPKAALGVAAVLGVALALWAGSWMVADGIVGRAMKLDPGPEQVAALRSAQALNPLSQSYRWLVAEALVKQAVAEQNAGTGSQAVGDTMDRAASAYQAALAADPGDMLIRIEYSNFLVSYARVRPQTDAASLAVSSALAATALAPREIAAVVALAKAYSAAGRTDDALKATALARELAPAYAMQTLGPLGSGSTTPTP